MNLLKLLLFFSITFYILYHIYERYTYEQFFNIYQENIISEEIEHINEMKPTFTPQPSHLCKHCKVGKCSAGICY